MIIRVSGKADPYQRRASDHPVALHANRRRVLYTGFDKGQAYQPDAQKDNLREAVDHIPPLDSPG